MKNKPKTQTEWLLEIEALANESVSEECLGQLEELLRQHPEARLAYAQWSQLQIDLGMVIQAEDLVGPVLREDVGGLLSDDPTSKSGMPLVDIAPNYPGLDGAAPSSSFFSGSFWDASWSWLAQLPGRGGPIAGALVVVVGIIAGIIWQLAITGPWSRTDSPPAARPQQIANSDRLPSKVFGPPEKQKAIGRIKRLESQVLIERDGAKQIAVEGMDILAADSLDVLAGGSAELTLADHSLAMLGPSTMLAFSSASEAVLQEGFVQIDARRRRADSPLAIATSNASAQIQVARLAVGADRNRTQIRVSEGSVLAQRRTDGLEVEIPEGYCSTIAGTIDPEAHRTRRGSALLVVSAKSMALGEGEKEARNWERFDQGLADRILGDRLWRSATPARVRTYDELCAADFEDCAVMVLSVYPPHAGVEQKLMDLNVPQLPIPVVCLETTGFPILGFTGEKQGADFGFSPGPWVVDIAKPGHPLAAGMTGNGVELFSYNKRRSYGWGRPTESALSIAHIHDHPNHWMLFAYETGMSMARGIAPARRVGLFIVPASAEYNSPGLNLVDAAVDWCLDSQADLVGPNQMASFSVTYDAIAIVPNKSVN